MTAYRPLPQSKASTLVERLSQATAGSTNDVTVRGIERDARTLMDVDVVGAHTVLGGTAALRWDADAVHDHYRIALQHRATAATYYNYSVALQNIEEADSAFEAVTNALKNAPDDRFLLDHAVGLALQAGRLAAGLRLCERWASLVPDERHPATRSLQQLTAAIKQGAFSESAVRRVLETMRTVQRDEHVRGAATATLEDPREPGTFLHEQHVKAAPAVAAELNALFVAEMASRPDLLHDPGFGFVGVFVSTDA